MRYKMLMCLGVPGEMFFGKKLESKLEVLGLELHHYCQCPIHKIIGWSTLVLLSTKEILLAVMPGERLIPLPEIRYYRHSDLVELRPR